jgi:acyl-CoA thioester hydrolase
MTSPPKLPSSATGIATTTTPGWFDYPICVSPHHTDHGGVVWHGTYLTWMEEARIAALRAVGVEYVDLVALGCELPVIDLALKYHKSLRMGDSAIVRCRMQDIKGIRLVWDYEIRSMTAGRSETIDYDLLHLSGQVTLVAVDWEKGKVMRTLPPAIKEALVKITMQ